MTDQVDAVVAVLRALADQRGTGSLLVEQNGGPGGYRYTIEAGVIGQTAVLYRSDLAEAEFQAALRLLLPGVSTPPG